MACVFMGYWPPPISESFSQARSVGLVVAEQIRPIRKNDTQLNLVNPKWTKSVINANMYK